MPRQREQAVPAQLAIDMRGTHRHPDEGFSDSRTPAKHRTLRAHVGRDVGSAPYVSRKWRIPYGGHLLVDCTAGSALGNGVHEWERGCSPGIFSYLAAKNPNIRVRLYERSREVFQELISNLSLRLLDLGFQQRTDISWQHALTRSTVDCIFGDGRSEAFDDLRPHEWLYVSNDPNNMHGWVLDLSRLAQVMTTRNTFVTFMSTMGCNAGGLKRLSFEDRSIWFEHIERAQSIVRRRQHIDLQLFTLARDPDQWAYLMLIPEKWTADNLEFMRRQFEKEGRRADAFSWRMDSETFDETCRYLFLTRKERGHE